MNTYSSLVLSIMPGHKRRTGRSRHPPGSVMMASSRDDAASEITSIDGDLEMSTSFAKVLATLISVQVLEVLTTADKTATPARDLQLC